MAEKSLKLTTKVPNGDVNGLADPRVIKTVMAQPGESYLAMVMFTVPKTEKDNITGDEVGKVELIWIEPVVDDTHGNVRDFKRNLVREYERRNGLTQIDPDLEKTIDEAMRRVGVTDDDL